MTVDSVKQKQHESKFFTKYGMMFTYGVVMETRLEWKPVERQITLVKDMPPRSVMDWEPTGAQVQNSYVVWAKIQDDEYCQGGKSINLYSTPDGPILGIALESDETQCTLLDPCVVQLNKNLQFVPIFNVGRTLQLYKSAIRSVQAPAELLLGAYPGFLVQHRMFKYQLKATNAPMQEVPYATGT